MADFARNPLSRYPEPKYPELCDHRAPTGSAVGAVKRIVAVALVGLGSGAVFPGCKPEPIMMGGAPSPYLETQCPLSEARAREVLAEELAARGYSIQEDYPISVGEASFDADGFDKTAGIGYEYQAHSEGDALDYAVEEMLWQRNAGAGPFFLVLDEYSYSCESHYDEETLAIEALRADVEAFFDALAKQGVL